MAFQKLILGSNLKMYKNNQQTLEYLNLLQSLTRNISREKLDLFVLPSYTSLSSSTQAVSPTLIRIGAQNVHWKTEGRFTGEVSAPMLKEIGANMVMIGHAERRQVFGETDYLVNQRVITSLENGLRVLICVGDTNQDKENGICEERLAMQLKVALRDVNAEQLSNVWLAYEPMWAIGEDGTVATPEFANQMHDLLHNLIKVMYPELEIKVPVLYGGSVNINNAVNLISQPQIDGLFIGRAAWIAHEFDQLIRTVLFSVFGSAFEA